MQTIIHLLFFCWHLPPIDLLIKVPFPTIECQTSQRSFYSHISISIRYLSFIQSIDFPPLQTCFRLQFPRSSSGSPNPRRKARNVESQLRRMGQSTLQIRLSSSRTISGQRSLDLRWWNNLLVSGRSILSSQQSGNLCLLRIPPQKGFYIERRKSRGSHHPFNWIC